MRKGPVYAGNRAMNVTKTTTERDKKLIAINIITSLVLAASIFALVWTILFTSFTPSLSGIRPPGQVIGSDRGTSYIMVLGIDEVGLADTMMVVKIDSINERAAILQIPRDLFIGVELNTGWTGRVNAVFAGARREGLDPVAATKQMINQYLGLPIDHHIILSLEGFRNTVDAMGGVPMNLERQFWVRVEGDARDFAVGPGEVILDARQAEGIVRHRRSFAQGDLGRMTLQRDFMKAFAEHASTMSVNQLLAVFRALDGETITDFTAGNARSLLSYARDIDMSEILVAAVPGQSGTFTPQGFSSARSYFSIHKQDYVDLINEHFLPPDRQVTIYDLRVSELHTVRNPSQTFSPDRVHEREEDPYSSPD